MPKGKRKKKQEGEAKPEGSEGITDQGLSGPDSALPLIQDPAGVSHEETVKAAAVLSTGSIDQESETPYSDDILELLLFRLADEEYAVDILKVQEIIRLTEITRIPRAPKLLRGVISLRGTILPIIDVRARLGLEERPENRKTRILVLKIDRGLMGFIADVVIEVIKVELTKIESSSNIPGRGASDLLVGILRVKDRMIILLDIERAADLE